MINEIGHEEERGKVEDGQYFGARTRQNADDAVSTNEYTDIAV